MIGTSAALRLVYRRRSADPRPGLFLYRLDGQRFCEGGALSDGGNLHAWLAANAAASAPTLHSPSVRPLGTASSSCRSSAASGRSAGTRAARGPSAASRSPRAAVDIAQAALECVCYQLADVLDALGGAESVVATGGALLANADWTQILADVLGRPLEVSAVGEGSARGAAMMALERARLAGPARTRRAASWSRGRTGMKSIWPPGQNNERRSRRSTHDRDRRRRARGGQARRGLQGRRRRGADHHLVAGPASARITGRHSPSGCCAGSRSPKTRSSTRSTGTRRTTSSSGSASRSGRSTTCGAETIVLATGSRPRLLDGALPLRTLDDSLELRRLAGGARTATVIGGGFVGCEVTASLTQLGLQVTQVVRDADALRTAAGAAALRGPARHVPRARRRPQAGGDRGASGRPRRRRHRRRAERRARPRRRASRFGAASSSTSASRPRAPAPTRSATSPSSTTRSTGATGGSSTGRTRPTTARRSAGSWPARTPRYDTVSAFFSEEFGRSFKVFGDADRSRLDGAGGRLRRRFGRAALLARAAM